MTQIDKLGIEIPTLYQQKAYLLKFPFDNKGLTPQKNTCCLSICALPPFEACKGSIWISKPILIILTENNTSYYGVLQIFLISLTISQNINWHQFS